MANPRVPRIPSDWTVWAFADPHAVLTGLRSALQAAGLIDSAGRWVAPPRTALVGCGDYIDRGTNSPGVMDLLRRLQTEARAGDGRVILTRGNHEQIVVQIARGEYEMLGNWLEYGGQAMLASYGYGPADVRDLPDVFRRIEAVSPGVLRWMDRLPEAVRWRDVLFVHGGLPAGAGPDDLGVTTDRHLWVRAEFFDTPWSSGAFSRFERAGIKRVVFGHTPQPHGARVFHDGRSLAIDTNASGNPHLPADAEHSVTLVRFEGDVELGDAPRVVIHTERAPDRANVALLGPLEQLVIPRRP